MPDLSPTLSQNPQLDQWLQFNKDNTVTVCTGKVELGQGIKTAIAIICAEELDIPISQVKVQSGDTLRAPIEFMTAGSMSIEGSGSAVRQACAEARAFVLQLAAERLELSTDQLSIDNGIIRNREGNESTSYWELMADRRFDTEITGEAAPKHFSKYTLVGRRTTRIDLLAKVRGEPSFIQDLQFENLAHGRVVRPPGYNFRLQAIDTTTVEEMPGVLSVVVDGSFVGVVAESELKVVAAVRQLANSCSWHCDETLPKPEDIHDFLMNNVDISLPVVEGMPVDETIPAFKIPQGQKVRLAAIYRKPYHMHGSLGPSAAVALWEDEQLTLWTHSQGPIVVRGAIAQVVGLAAENIHVIHVENAGCYGHNGADDAAMDATLLARATPSRPVLLQWTRHDEHTWEPYSPAMVLQLAGSVDKNGRISAWDHQTYSNTHGGRPFPSRSVSGFLAAWHMAKPIPKPEARPAMAPHGGMHRNADPYYDITNKRIVKNLVKQAPIRTSSTRGLGAYGNVFAIESFMDELAHASEQDPVQFRIDHLSDGRAIEVIRAAVSKAEEQTLPASDQKLAYGRGLAFARYKNAKCYAAVSVDLSVDVDTSEIRLLHAVIAGDAGQIIDPDGLANQLEGGFIQSASWTLKEQVRFDENRILSEDWESYPILTFEEIPTVDVVLLDHPELPSLGSGEATQGPTPAAIANAVFNAVGIRLRDIPFMPDKLMLAAMAQ